MTDTVPSPEHWQVEPWDTRLWGDGLAIVSRRHAENDGEIIAEFTGINAEKNAEIVMSALKLKFPTINGTIPQL